MQICLLRRSPLLGIAVSWLMVAWLFAGLARAQDITGTMTGVVKDATGAVVPNTTVTATQVETGLMRTAVTSASGNYTVAALPIGHYEVTAEARGFKREVHRGIALAVGETAVINMTLEEGAAQQQVTVTGEAPIVNTTTSLTAGEVSPEQVKDLPLNGRSYDQLLTLDTNVANYTENDTRPSFSVSGQRGESNRFLLNGIELIGNDASGSQPLPTGSSGSLLGVEAIQEFNVETNAYGAEFGKRAGGQVNIVTSSGTNHLHGDAFYFVRNTDANANGFFSTPETPTSQNRNQFGGEVGSRILKDKLFVFGAYEGVRQITRTGSVATVPDAEAQNGDLPDSSGVYRQVSGLNSSMLPIVQSAWIDPATYPGGCTEVLSAAGLPTGECNIVAAPSVQVREDSVLARTDYMPSAKDSWAVTFDYDNGNTNSEGLIPTNGLVAPLGMSLLSLQETRVFSPQLLNVATFGYSRATASQTPTPYELYSGTETSIPSADYFVSSSYATPGEIDVNSGIAPGLGNQQGILDSTRTFFTLADDLHKTKGRHNMSFGVWLQQIEVNSSGSPADLSGDADFASLPTLLQGTALSYVAVPNPTALSFRSTEYAGYWQDNIKVRHNLNLTIGLRVEGDTGWNEHTGRDSNYDFNPDGAINTNPQVGVSPFITNNALHLLEPRLGIAWDPTGSGKTSVRLGGGIFDDLQDNLNYLLMSNPPFNTRLSYTNVNFPSVIPTTSASILPQCESPIAPQNGTTCTVPEVSGVDPNMKTPSTVEWNLGVEHQLTRNLVAHVGYEGFLSQHDQTLDDANQPIPIVCSNPTGCASGGANTGVSGEPIGTVPNGTTYLPLSINPTTLLPDGCRLNCDILDTQTWFYNADSSYQSANAYLQQRYSNGITFRVNYTWEKIVDYSSGMLGPQNQNAPANVLDFWNLALDRGPAAYNVSQQLNFNFDAALPFGKGRRWANHLGPLADAWVGGWQFNGIFTAQTGFPITPLLGVDVSGNGDSHIVDVPNVTSGCSVVNPGNVTHYYNDACFTAPLAGTYGDESVGEFTGPGFVNLDLSLFKKFPVFETKTVEFRVEAFNLLNHPNFGTPNLTAFTASGTAVVPSATYGEITSLNGNMRELQFAVKFIF